MTMSSASRSLQYDCKEARNLSLTGVAFWADVITKRVIPPRARLNFTGGLGGTGLPDWLTGMPSGLVVVQQYTPL
jgi:hypothetical protein